MREWMIDLAPPGVSSGYAELYKRLRNVWMAYLRGQIVLMLVVGVAFTIAWLILGIPWRIGFGRDSGFVYFDPRCRTFSGGDACNGRGFVGRLQLDSTFKFLGGGHYVGLTYLVLINLKNFFVRPIIMGRSLHMNEALIFIAIMIATILEGIMGALLVVPVLASVIVIMEYLRRRILGLPAFDAEDEKQFVTPPEKIKPQPQLNFPQRKNGNRIYENYLFDHCTHLQ